MDDPRAATEIRSQRPPSLFTMAVDHSLPPAKENQSFHIFLTSMFKKLIFPLKPTFSVCRRDLVES